MANHSRTFAFMYLKTVLLSRFYSEYITNQSQGFLV